MKKRIIKYGGAITGEAEERAIIKSIQKSRKTRNWQQGEEGALLEKETAKFLNVDYGILTTSGSCAGLLALSALELSKGSEVIIPAVTFPTIFNIILQSGLVPVVVDCDVGTYNLNPHKLEEAISYKTKAIIVVHALGNPVNMPEVMKVANKHNLYVLEDNCDGWGSEVAGAKVGSFGDISFTSFHAAHIVSMGVGGGVFTRNRTLAQRVRMYRDWGRQADVNRSENTTHKSLPKDYNPRFIYEKVGFNFQILDLQAAMGRVQLKKAGKIKKMRKHNFNYLYKNLAKHKDLVLPVFDRKTDICWFAFPLTTNGDRGALLKHLEKWGIETRPMFAGQIHKHPAYEDTKYRLAGKLEGSNRILNQSFWISCHPALTSTDLKYIIEVFDRYYGKA